MTRTRWTLAALAVSLALSPAARADLSAVLKKIPAPPAPAEGAHVTLPQKQEFARTLRAFLATLKEPDFRPEYRDLSVLPADTQPADLAPTAAQFRQWVLAVAPPSVGYKRNRSSVMIHPALFTLGVIEGEKDVMMPPANPAPLIALANWEYAGNPYADSRALRLRAFVLCAVEIIMLDDLLENGDAAAKPNQDRLGGIILRLADCYPGFEKLLPAEVRAAYLAGLKRFVRRALDHGPKMLPETLGYYTMPAAALAVAAPLLKDEAIDKEVEAYARMIYADPRFFRAAGYFPHGGTLDSFNGISLLYAAWGAAAGRWPFARDAVAACYRLRAHLTLPEPDGALVGPSHMGALTSTEPIHDQWDWPARAWGAAVVTDEAACMTKMPSDDEIRRSAAAIVSSVGAQLHELSWAKHGLEPSPWRAGSGGGGSHFAYRYLPADYFERRKALEKTEMAKLPLLRAGGFVRRFGEEFLVAKNDARAVILHTGPITNPDDPDSGVGFGGGCLSAFWTPSTGAVILGRGIGAWSPMYKARFDNWRSLPTHAVLGLTASGKVFTSADLNQPALTFDVTEKSFVVVASGAIPAKRKDEPLFSGRIDYERRFESTPGGVTVKTTVTPTTEDSVAELYEALPVFLRERDMQRAAEPTRVEWLIDGKWVDASERLSPGVSAARLTRFKGAVTVTFEKPVSAKLAPEWRDTYMSHASCRNVLIDLLGGDGSPAVMKGARSVSYRIEASRP